jgi:hypothetical protein
MSFPKRAVKARRVYFGASHQFARYAKKHYGVPPLHVRCVMKALSEFLTQELAAGRLVRFHRIGITKVVPFKSNIPALNGWQIKFKPCGPIERAVKTALKNAQPQKL